MSENFALPKRPIAVQVMSAAVSGIRWALLAGILIILAPYGLAFVDNARGYAATARILEYQEQMVRGASPRLQQYVPTRISGKDRTDWILAAGLAAFAIVLGSLRDRVVSTVTARQMRSQLGRWKDAMQLQEDSKAAAALNARFKEFESAKSVSRAELLRAFADAKKNLDALGKEVAFLSIDVVGSTAMKEGEESAAIQYDFGEYRKLVEKVFAEQEVLKSTWTPDGVMACFADINHAIQAGKDVILRLEGFNKNVKLMKQNFAVRCGVNAGYVHFDEHTPLEQMSDRVIDIAGHMQKYAEPNTVAVARKVIEPLRSLDGFEATTTVVDGYEVSRWSGPRHFHLGPSKA